MSSRGNKTASTAAAPSAKRRADQHDPSISPPPTKRKNTAAANFFTPTSQKPKSRVVWAERAPKNGSPATLLVAKYQPEGTSDENKSGALKIASFDLDSTIITTASGKKHASDAADWKWWHPSVPKRLRELHQSGHRLVIFSNQGGLVLHPEPSKQAKAKPTTKKGTDKADRLASFRERCDAILTRLDLPVLLYAATGHDIFRKPRSGMWEQLSVDGVDVETAVAPPGSFFVGDAAGRPASVRDGRAVSKDFSCSDRNFASNISGLIFHTPEEFFLDEPPHVFARAFDLVTHPLPDKAADEPLEGLSFKKPSSPEVLLFCGPPAAGKSSFFHDYLAPLSYRRVNQDTLKTKEKCKKAAAEFLKDGASVVIDNTNPDVATRALWIELARQHSAPIRCLWFRTDMAICEHNDVVRALNEEMNPEGRGVLPRIAFNGFTSRFKEPRKDEGFDEVVDVPFRFRGTTEKYAVWGRYWT